MKTNIATTQEQAARLLRCGVSADTADMCRYIESGEINIEKLRLDTELIGCSYDDPKRHYEYIPAWSLSALLGLLPDIITYGGYQWGMFMTKLSKDCVCISYARWDNFNSTIGHLSGDSIEVCVKAIEWLTENNYKLNEQ